MQIITQTKNKIIFIFLNVLLDSLSFIVFKYSSPPYLRASFEKKI